MKDELIRNGLRMALRELPDGRPDLGAVTKLSRRYRVRSYVFRAVAATAVAAVVAVPHAMMLPLLTGSSDDPSPTRGAAKGSTQPSTTPPTFVPPSYLEGDRTVVPVTFPDGTTAELLFSSEVGAATFGVAGSHVRAGWAAPRESAGGCGWEFVVSYGDPHGSLYRGKEPIAAYGGASSHPVELWQGVNDNRFALVYRSDRWTVTLPCEEPIEGNADAHQEWARSLILRETPEGFLVLDSVPPLTLGLSAGYERPGLEFGGHEWFQLRPGPCQPLTAQGVEIVNGVRVATFPGGASWCLPEASMSVTAYGGAAFIDELVRGLDVRRTRLA